MSVNASPAARAVRSLVHVADDPRHVTRCPGDAGTLDEPAKLRTSKLFQQSVGAVHGHCLNDKRECSSPMRPVHHRYVGENGECTMARGQQNGGPCTPETAVRVLIRLRKGAHRAKVTQPSSPVVRNARARTAALGS